MPLGEREGDTSKSRFIGVETYFNKSMTVVLDNNIFLEKGCDFVVAPLMSPTYRPSLMQQFGSISVELRLPFTKSDLNPSAKIWNTKVIGKISEWIDLDSPDQTLRKDSETVLKQEIDKAAYLSLQACLLPTPKRNTCANYARCVNQYLQLKGLDQMQLWLRIPLGKPDDNSSAIFRTPADCWKIWNSFRLLCDHHSNLLVTLDNLNALPADNSLNSWYGEPVSAFIIHTDCFFTTGDDENVKHLSKNLQKSITYFLDHSTQIIISEDRVNYKEMEEYCFDTCSVAGTDHRIHRLHPYMDCVRSLYQQLDPLSERERSLFAFRDDLQPTVQPFKDTLEYVAYQNSDDDEKKFTKYKRAICQALLDRVPDEKASEITTVLVVIGAGRGPLVRTLLKAAEVTGRKLKVYAVERNLNALSYLHKECNLNKWNDIVTLVHVDVRYWAAPEAADILVSDLLGSFGDNELAPESLDGAQRFLKKDGISIPSSYTSFLQPVTAWKLHSAIKAKEDILRFETAYMAKMHNVARLAPSQPLFTFTHPKSSNKESNNRYRNLQFVIPESAVVHGFAGYFDATLYKDVHLGTEPTKATPGVITWDDHYFPLREPICVHRGSTLEVNFWRCCDYTKVWYEWCVTSPSPSLVHNCNARADCMWLN
ncbi:protein arginine N-methyltransferase 1.5-like isoform X1 [Cicer arietinum]|uniref:protein arginine N-methyltransferase 1.5-like isoform X1 n=1 Tax=Cicer arietinum TaxID=3827 RepID=UPI003CC51F4A